MPEYKFVAPLLQMETGMRFHYLPIPAEIVEDMLADDVRRVVGTLNGTEINRGLVGDGEGGRILVLGLNVMRDIGIRDRDLVEADLKPDPNPDHVELCEEFQVALDMDDEAAERFFGWTPGKQRSLAHYINSAKREETRIKRALEITLKLRTYGLYGDTHPDQ